MYSDESFQKTDRKCSCSQRNGTERRWISRLLWDQEVVTHVGWALVSDGKESEYVYWAGTLPGEMRCSQRPSPAWQCCLWLAPRVDMAGLRQSMCCVGLFIILRTIGKSAGESSRVCWKPELQLLRLHPSLLCNVTHYHIPQVAQSHRIV